jgi:tetratricopeptide (TPR) repeat protein
MIYLTTKYVLVSLISFTSVAAELPFNAEVDSLIRLGTLQTLNNQFDSAMVTFGKVEKMMPEHPAGAAYLAGTLQSRMFHYETSRFEAAFYAWADSAIVRGKHLLGNNPEDVWLHFYLGSAYGYLGLYEAKRGSLVGGFRSAGCGLDHLKKAIELDSTMYDAYLGVGNYMYWSGKFYKYLRFLPWIRDERDKGVAFVRKAVDKGLYSGWIGVNSLAWIEYDRGECESALILFLKGDSAFPNNPFWLWGLAETQKKCELYEASIQTYQTLLSIVRFDSLDSGLNEVVARYKMMLALYELERYAEVVQQADEALKRKIESTELERAEGYLKKVKKLREKCMKRIKN